MQSLRVCEAFNFSFLHFFILNFLLYIFFDSSNFLSCPRFPWTGRSLFLSLSFTCSSIIGRVGVPADSCNDLHSGDHLTRDVLLLAHKWEEKMGEREGYYASSHHFPSSSSSARPPFIASFLVGNTYYGLGHQPDLLRGSSVIVVGLFSTISLCIITLQEFWNICAGAGTEGGISAFCTRS